MFINKEVLNGKKLFSNKEVLNGKTISLIRRSPAVDIMFRIKEVLNSKQYVQ